VRPLLNKSKRNGWHVGVLPAEGETALAIVRTTRSGRRLLRHCAIHSAIEIRAEHVLAPLRHSRDLAHARVSAILSADDYRLVQVEAPEVQAGEMRAAVRWKLRDAIDFPVSDCVVDVFDIPAQSRYATERVLFAVAARGEAVRRLVGLVKPRVRGFDVIDIPELCLRNVSALLPQDKRGVAFLALAEGFAQLILTCQGTLYLARRIDLTQRSDVLAFEERAESATGPLAVEIQRSLNYYESHFDRDPIGDLVVACADEQGQRLFEPLRSETGLNVEPLNVRELFTIEGDLEPDTRFSGLIALGAALRTERGS